MEVKKVLDERIDKGMLRWFGNVERMENDRISKKVYVVYATVVGHSYIKPLKGGSLSVEKPTA